MMYNNKFVVAVKANGRVLREFADTVYVPFGQEYAICLKNVNSRRAQVKVSIDGTDVLGGSSLVIGANQSLDLERYLHDLNRGNKFKFIERTDNIEKHRGIKAEDGLIRVEFAFERVHSLLGGAPVWYSGSAHNIRPFDYNDCSGSMVSTTQTCYTSNACTGSVASSCAGASNGALRSAAQAGITVKGSISDQSFSTVSNFVTDASEVIVMRLVGDTGQNLITAPVTVKHKVECESCGRQNKMSAKFCSECGTALSVI